MLIDSYGSLQQKIVTMAVPTTETSTVEVPTTAFLPLRRLRQQTSGGGATYNSKSKRSEQSTKMLVSNPTTWVSATCKFPTGTPQSVKQGPRLRHLQVRQPQRRADESPHCREEGGLATVASNRFPEQALRLIVGAEPHLSLAVGQRGLHNGEQQDEHDGHPGPRRDLVRRGVLVNGLHGTASAFSSA